MNSARIHTPIIQLIIVTLIVILTSTTPVAGPPPRIDIPSSFPGEIAGSSSMRWVAPYVLLEEVTIADKSIGKVTWYSKDGDIIKEVSGGLLEANSYYILQRVADTTLIHSVHNTRAIKLLPQQGGSDSYIHGQDYGKYFYYQYTNAQGSYTDFYANGSLVGTYGPHCWFVGRTFNVSVSGSFACSLEDTA